MDYLFPIYTSKYIDSLLTYPVDLSISETELSQSSIPSGLVLLPVLLHRHLDNAHDWQLHSLQLPSVHYGFFWIDQRPTIIQFTSTIQEDMDKSGSNRLLCTIFTLSSPPRFDFENWHVLEWLPYQFIYGVFPLILNLVHYLYKQYVAVNTISPIISFVHQILQS